MNRRRILKIRRLLFGARCARTVCDFCGQRAPLWYQWRKAKEFEAGMRLLDTRRHRLHGGMGIEIQGDLSDIERAVIKRVNATR